MNTNAEQETYSKSKRIASNTILLFIRMFVLTIINLYAVRLVLKGLGEENYGIYNAVAGVVTSTSFISSVLALSVQRFYSIALGENDSRKLNDIFSASINIVIVITIIILLIFETIGVWFINTQMTIPAERMPATLLLFQFSMFAFAFSIIQIPYTATIFAHENMGIYALISTVECVGRLVVAFMIGRALFDNLAFYGSGLFIVAFVVLFLYIVIGRKKYCECHYHRVRKSKLYIQLLSFSGWTTFGSVANTAMIQGGTILLNVFFGPIANVAFGIALQINNAFTALANSMALSFRPAMIKAYAEDKFDYVNQLFSVSNKLLLYVLIAIAAPIASEMRTILRIWLGYVNDNTLLFSQLMIVYIICVSMHNPITIIIHASGNIKGYHLKVESLILLCMPLAWLLFSIGMPSYSILYVMIGVCVVAHFVRLLCLRHCYKTFSIRHYFTSLILPATAIVAFGTVLTYILHSNIENAVFRLIVVGILSPLIIFLLAYFIGITKQEREILKSYIISCLKHHTCHR